MANIFTHLNKIFRYFKSKSIFFKFFRPLNLKNQSICMLNLTNRSNCMLYLRNRSFEEAQLFWNPCRNWWWVDTSKLPFISQFEIIDSFLLPFINILKQLKIHQPKIWLQENFLQKLKVLHTIQVIQDHLLKMIPKMNFQEIFCSFSLLQASDLPWFWETFLSVLSNFVSKRLVFDSFWNVSKFYSCNNAFQNVSTFFGFRARFEMFQTLSVSKRNCSKR